MISYGLLNVTELFDPPDLASLTPLPLGGESDAYLRAIFDHAPIGIALADMEGRLIASNRALQEMLQYSEEEIRNSHWSRFAHPDDIQMEDELDDRIIAGEIDSYELESRRIRRDGVVIWTRMTVAEVRDSRGEAQFGIAMLEDITRRKAMESLLAHQALHDALTGLPNRVLLQDRIQKVIESSRREGARFALLLLDLDRFKELNDTLGHHFGDLLLSQVATRLRGALRASDTVARLGGDEFALVLPACDAVGAGMIAEKVRGALTVPFELDGYEFIIDASVGVAVFPEHGSDLTTLLRHADIAMYAAKRAGSGHAVYPSDPIS